MIKALTNTCFKKLKAFLVLEIRNISSFVTLIRIKFLNFSFFNFLYLDKFLNILLALLSTSKILLLLVLKVVKANLLDDLVVFNIKISNTAILCK